MQTQKLKRLGIEMSNSEKRNCRSTFLRELHSMQETFEESQSNSIRFHRGGRTVSCRKFGIPMPILKKLTGNLTKSFQLLQNVEPVYSKCG